MTSLRSTLFRRYVAVLATSAVMLLVAVAAFNVVVDPYTLFGTTRVEGFNALKPFAVSNGRLAKRHAVRHARPHGLIIGNSRPELGIDPALACWPQAAQPVFNLASPGMSYVGQMRYAQHGLAVSDVKFALVAVDMIDFMEATSNTDDPTRWPPDDKVGARLAVDALGEARPLHVLDRAMDYAKSVFSLSTFQHAVLTAAQQSTANASTMTELGFHDASGLYGGIVAREGTSVLFESKSADVMRFLTREPWAMRQAGQDWTSGFEAFRRLLALLNEAGVETIVFTNAYHAHYLLSIDAAGLWPMFETWKTRLESVTAQAGVPLWDFARFDSYAMESPDDVATRGESLEWFHESAHYTRALGDLMLTQMLGTPCGSGAADAHGRLPGARLSAESLPAELVAQRQALADYRAANRRLYEKLETLGNR